jgi:hypothetical protein
MGGESDHTARRATSNMTVHHQSHLGTRTQFVDSKLCHTTTTHFLVKTIENVEEKLHFRMVCRKSLDTATLKRSVVLENRISILSLDTFLLWIFIEMNSLSSFENW